MAGGGKPRGGGRPHASRPDEPALAPPPAPPTVHRPAAAGHGRAAGILAPLVGLCLLAGVWSWRAITSSAASPVVFEAGAGPVTGTHGGEVQEASPRPAGGTAAGAEERERAGDDVAPSGKVGDAAGPAVAGVGPPPGGPDALASGSQGSGAPASGAGSSGEGSGPDTGDGPGVMWSAPYGGASAGMGGRPAGSGTSLIVHVAGAVVQPGVYLLPSGARVVDAVTAAGGPAAEAALHALNLAAPLADGMRVHVPTQKEVAAGQFVPGQDGTTPAGGTARAEGPGTAAGGAAGNGTRRIDINRASAAELEALPGIGPALAQRIVADREVNGPFRRPQDLSRVTGIGEKTLARLLPYITTGP